MLLVLDIIVSFTKITVRTHALIPTVFLNPQMMDTKMKLSNTTHNMFRKIQMEVFWCGIRRRGHMRISVREGAPMMVSAYSTVYPGVLRLML